MIHTRPLTRAALAALRAAADTKWLWLGCRGCDLTQRFDTELFIHAIASSRAERQSALADRGLLLSGPDRRGESDFREELFGNCHRYRVFVSGRDGRSGIGRIEAVSERFVRVITDYRVHRPALCSAGSVVFAGSYGFCALTGAEAHRLLESLEPCCGDPVYTDFTPDSLTAIETAAYGRLVPQYFRAEGRVAEAADGCCLITIPESPRLEFTVGCECDPAHPLRPGEQAAVEGYAALLKPIRTEKDGAEHMTVEAWLTDSKFVPCSQAAADPIDPRHRFLTDDTI